MIKNSRRNNRKKINNNGNKTAPQMELSKTLTMNKTSGCVVNIVYPAKIWTYTVSSNFSFGNASDTRYLSFAQVISNTFPFVDFALVYSDYKILSASAIVTPTTVQTVSTGMLYMTCDSNGLASNPTNSTVIGTQSAHLFTAVATQPKSITYRFPGVGTTANIWLDTSVSPAGAFYIGSNTTGVGYGSNAVIFDVSLSLQISFRNVKTS